MELKKKTVAKWKFEINKDLHVSSYCDKNWKVITTMKLVYNILNNSNNRNNNENDSNAYE